MVVGVLDSDGALEARFAQVPVLARVVSTQHVEQGRHVDVVVIVKVTKPPAMAMAVKVSAALIRNSVLSAQATRTRNCWNSGRRAYDLVV